MNKDKQMKLRNLLITLGLTFTVGAGVAVATSAKQSEEPKAAEAAGETWYIRGEMNGWERDPGYSITEGNVYRVLDINGTYQFKIATNDWATSLDKASGSAINNGVTWNGTNNSSITKGKYAFKISTGDFGVIEKLSSSSFSSGESIYLRLDSSFTASEAKCWINVLSTDGTTSYLDITTNTITAKDDTNLVKYTFAKDAYFFEINRKSSGGDNWGWSSTRVTSHTNNLFNVYHHSDWGWDKQVEIAEQSASIVNVTLTQPANGTIAVKNAFGSQSGAGYYYSDWSLEFTATPATDYYFGNWTDASGNDWQGSDAYDNPATLTNLSGEFGVSCKFLSYSNKVFKIVGATSGAWTAQTQDIDISLSYQTGTSSTDDGATYYSTSVSLSAGSVFKPYNVTDNVYYSYDALEEGGKSVKGTHIVRDSSNNNMKVVTTAVYEVYVKTTTGSVWMQLSSQSEATEYANTFLSTITCDSSGRTFSINAWNIVGEATTSMEYLYTQLTSGAKNVLTGAQADKDSADPIKQCAARYDRILGKYGYGTGSGQYHDFMGRTPAPQASARLVFGQITNNNIAIIVIIVSMIGAASLGAYYFFKKSKKSEE